jgi:hypothetical protein
MEIAFNVESVALNRAIGVVSIVTPQTGGGFLFMVRQETCDVYSRDGKHEARASFPVSDVVGEGAFILPAEAVSGLSYVSGELKFRATEAGGAHKVKYTFGESGLVEQVSLDPRTMHMFERDVTAAREAVAPKEFPIKLLQFALATTKSYLPKAADEVDQDVYRTIRVFGNADPELARANGHVQASNGKEMCYFHCGAFLDKDLSFPSQHLSMIEAFLGRSSGNVAIYQTDTKVYMINSHADVLGWPRHTIEYKKFHWLAKTDEIVVKVAPSEIIPRLKMMRANLAKEKNNKIRMHFDPATGYISFSSVDESKVLNSDPVTTESVEIKVSEPRTMNVNVGHLLHMFEGIRGDKVEFRVRIQAADQRRPRERYSFRTIDGFLLNEDGIVVGGLIDNPPEDLQYPPKGAYECRVTRYAPGID